MVMELFKPNAPVKNPPPMQLTWPLNGGAVPIASAKLQGLLPEQAVPVPPGDAYLWPVICACVGDDNETTAASAASKQANRILFMESPPFERVKTHLELGRRPIGANQVTKAPPGNMGR
jgi:hypothetical protein